MRASEGLQKGFKTFQYTPGGFQEGVFMSFHYSLRDVAEGFQSVLVDFAELQGASGLRGTQWVFIAFQRISGGISRVLEQYSEIS